MFAKYLDEVKKDLVPVHVRKAPECIAELFGGKAFPVIHNDKLIIATYERDIDCLFLNGEISHKKVLELAAKEAENIYQGAITEAGKKAVKLMLEVYEELKMLSPPWEE